MDADITTLAIISLWTLYRCQQAPDTGFPSHYFNFTQYRDLYSRIDVKEGLLTDYIGCVQYVTGLHQSVKVTKEVIVWRDIGIQNLDGHTVRFTLWNDKAQTYDMTAYENIQKPVVIAVTSCLVKNYGGLQLSSTAATHYYLNLDTPETVEILNVYGQFIEPPVILDVQHQRCTDVEQEKKRNRVTLNDLLKENPENQQNVRFTVIATIDNIDTQRPRFFKKCRTCKSKVSKRFLHPHCNQSTIGTNPNYSYCFRVLLSDSASRIHLTCFSDEANCSVKDCNDILQKLENKDSYTYPPELLALQGETRIFQLHFAKESTKESQRFILDTAWKDMPLLTAGTSATAENLPESLQLFESCPLTSEDVVKGQAIEAPTKTNSPPANTDTKNVPTSSANVITPIQPLVPIETNDVCTPLPEQQTSLPEPTNPKYEPRKKTLRKPLFLEGKNNNAEGSQKRPKTEE